MCCVRNLLIISLTGLALLACSPLSKTQLEAVRNLAFRSDTVSRSPVVLFSEMSAIRMERGLFYASSFSSGQARFDELTSLAEASMEDVSLVRKSEIYVDVLNSYIRALRSLSSESRWKSYGTEIRGIGNRVDSVVYRFNRLDAVSEEVPEGYARLAGKVLGYVLEEIAQSVQAVSVKDIVIAADTLVSASCDSLMDILRGEEMDMLIDHEQAAVRDNYSAYLRYMEVAGYYAPVAEDRMYVDLLRRAENLSDIRNSCVSALRSLKNAHARLADDFALGKKDVEQELWDELLRFNRLASQVADRLKEPLDM